MMIAGRRLCVGLAALALVGVGCSSGGTRQSATPSTSTTTSVVSSPSTVSVPPHVSTARPAARTYPPAAAQGCAGVGLSSHFSAATPEAVLAGPTGHFDPAAWSLTSITHDFATFDATKPDHLLQFGEASVTAKRRSGRWTLSGACVGQPYPSVTDPHFVRADLVTCRPRPPAGAINPGVGRLTKTFVPIAAANVRVCRYRISKGGSTLAGGSLLLPAAAARFEKQTNSLRTFPGARLGCVSNGNETVYAVTFASDAQEVTVVDQPCVGAFNGSLHAFDATTWEQELRDYSPASSPAGTVRQFIA